jgi:hypothetical protein
MSNVDSPPKSDYEVDLGMAAQEWSLVEHIPGCVEDLFSTAIPTPDSRYVKVPTHYVSHLAGWLRHFAYSFKGLLRSTTRSGQQICCRLSVADPSRARPRLR